MSLASLFRTNAKAALITTIVVAQLFAGLMPGRIAVTQAAGNTDPTPPNAAGTDSSSFDATKATWVDTATCLLSDIVSLPGGVVGGLTGGMVKISVGDCGKILVDKTSKAIGDMSGWASKGLDTIFDWILTLISNIVRAISLFMVATIVFFADPNVFRFATAPFVHAGWYVCLQVANMIIVLGLIVLANKYILGINKFGDYKSLTEYIIAALFLNFSLTLASMAIGISNFLTLTFLNLTGAPTKANPYWDIPVNFGDRLAEVFDSIAKFNDVAGGFSGLTSVFAGTMLGLVVLIILAAIAFSFVKRVVFFWAYLILLPLAYVLGNLGEAKNIAGFAGQGNAWQEWTKGFMKELVFGPVMAFFLWLTLLIVGNIGETYNPSYTSGLGITNLFTYLLAPFIFIFFLTYGFTTANKAANGGFGFAQNWITNVTDKYPKQIGAWAKDRAITRPALKADAALTQSTAMQKIKEWGARNAAVPVFGGMLGGLSKGIDTLEERNKKPMQDMVNRWAQSRNLKAITSGDRLMNMYEQETSMEGKAAIMNQLLAQKDGYKYMSAEIKTGTGPAKPRFDMDKVETLMKRAGQDFKKEEAYKFNPMMMPQNTPEEKAAFEKMLKDLKPEDIRRLGPKDDQGKLARAVIGKLDTADKVIAFAQTYNNHTAFFDKGTKKVGDIGKSFAKAMITGGLADMTVPQAKQLLLDKDIPDVFKMRALHTLHDTMSKDERVKLATSPNLMKIINDTFASKAKIAGVSDGKTFFQQ